MLVVTLVWNAAVDGRPAEREFANRYRRVGKAYWRMASKQKINVAFSDGVASIFVGCRCHRRLACGDVMEIIVLKNKSILEFWKDKKANVKVNAHQKLDRSSSCMMCLLHMLTFTWAPLVTLLS